MSWQVDPKTGDYKMTNGAPVDDASPIYPAYYRLKIRRNGWMYAPNSKYGSSLSAIQKNNTNVVINAAQVALDPIVDNGLAQAVMVQLDPTVQASRAQDAIQVSILNNSGQVETLPLPLPPVGD